MKRSDWLNNSFPEAQAKRSNWGESKSQKERRPTTALAMRPAIVDADYQRLRDPRRPLGITEALRMETADWRARYEQAILDTTTADERGLLGWRAEVIDRLQQTQGPFDREVTPTMRERQNRAL
jgi:type I site-specific restriction endonuclease